MSQPSRVSHYRLAWCHPRKEGAIALVISGLAQNSEIQLAGLSAEEFNAVAEMLRRERPIFWDSASQTVFTANEIVGEEEID